MKKLVVLSLSVLGLFSSSAFGADLVKSKPAAPAAPAFTWTGFYVGINAGGSWANRTANPALFWTSSDPLPTPDYLTTGAPTPFNIGSAGFIGGLQAGYNYQLGQFVVGAEIDFMGAALAGSGSDSKSYISTVSLFPTTNDITTKVEQNWLSTLRARAGFSVDRILVYATGGLAFGNVQTTSNAVNATPDMPYVGYWSGSRNEIKLGYAVGAGVEYALTNNWIIRGEYLYYNLGSATSYAYPTTQNWYNIPGPNTIEILGKGKITVDGNIVRAAISYKF